MKLRAPTADEMVTIGIVGGSVYPLPGILESIEVSDSLLVDDVEQEGKSGKIKVIHGWNDSDVSITVTLIDTLEQGATRYDALREIAQTFKQMKSGKPQVYTINTNHLAAWGLKQFVFNSLKSSEGRAKQTISCTLEFDEFDSTTGKSQGRQIAAGISEKPAPSAEVEVVGKKDRAGLGELEGKYAAN